jgi:Putative zinc-finger
MDWNCTLTEERLSDFIDGALSPDERAAFSTHEAGCAPCTKLVSQVSGLVSRMQQAAPLAVPPQLVGKILDDTLGSRRRKPASQGLFGWLPSLWQPRFAMGIVTVAASVLIVFHAAGSTTGNSNLNPLNLVRGANRQIHLTYAHGAKFVNDLRVVYEIQSRLSSQPEDMSEPISTPATTPSAEPQPGQQHQQPSTGPREKTETIPHSNRRDARNGDEVAMLLPREWTGRSSVPALRSPL